MATPPTLHTVDPLIAGRIELFVDTLPAGVNQLVFYMGTAPGGPYGTEFVNTIAPGVDGTDLILKVDGATRYWIAKAHDGAGYSAPSNEVTTTASAGPPPPPPPLTKLQEVEDAMGATLSDGDQIALYLQPAAKVLTVANGTLV